MLRTTTAASGLVNTSACAEIVKALLDALAVCDGTDIAIKTEGRDDAIIRGTGSDTDIDSRDELTSRVIMSVCLRVLVNLTNDQPTGCALVASESAVSDRGAVQDGNASSTSNGRRSCTRVNIKQESEQKEKQMKVATTMAASVVSVDSSGCATSSNRGGLVCVMRALVASLTYRWHDSLIVALALVVNLLEQNDECCEQLENLELRPSLEVTNPKAQPRACTERGLSQQNISIGSTENLLSAPAPAVSFFCDLYLSTACAVALDSTQTGSAAMPESQQDGGSDEDDDDSDGSSSLGIVSGYAAVLLGFLCLRRQATGCAARVRSRLEQADADCSSGAPKPLAGEAVKSAGLKGLIESVRSFGVVHAEAGVLHEGQARLFDEMIACLTTELEEGQG